MDLLIAAAPLFAGGLVAGLLGGLLGIGGGIVLMPLLRFVVGLPAATAAGTCVLAVFFTTLGGSYRNQRMGRLHLPSLVPVVLSGVVATSLFSLLFLHLAEHDHWLDLGVGLVFCLVSARMIVLGFAVKSPEAEAEPRVDGTMAQKTVIGSAAGVLPGLLGIGTGGILVPAFTWVLKAPVKTAMAASLACFCFNAFVSAAFKAGQGFVDPAVALPVCLGTFLGANAGALLNRRFRVRVVTMLFGVVFAYVAAKFILLSCGVRI